MLATRTICYSVAQCFCRLTCDQRMAGSIANRFEFKCDRSLATYTSVTKQNNSGSAVYWEVNGHTKQGKGIRGPAALDRLANGEITGNQRRPIDLVVRGGLHYTKRATRHACRDG